MCNIMDSRLNRGPVMLVAIAASRRPPTPVLPKLAAEGKLTISFQNATHSGAIVGTIHHDDMHVVCHHSAAHDTPFPDARSLDNGLGHLERERRRKQDRRTSLQGPGTLPGVRIIGG